MPLVTIKNMAKKTDYWLLYVAAACWMLFNVITTLWPAAYWFEVRSVEVQDSVAGASIAMSVDREIKRPFDAVWTAQVRTFKSDGTGYVACTASAYSEYKAGAELPKMLTMDWWTDGRCATLPPGRYMLSTAWRINPNGVFPSKIVRIDSNVFEVKP